MAMRRNMCSLSQGAAQPGFNNINTQFEMGTGVPEQGMVKPRCVLEGKVSTHTHTHTHVLLYNGAVVGAWQQARSAPTTRASG